MQSRAKKITFVVVLIIGALFLGYNYFFNNSIPLVSAAPSDCNIAGGGKLLKGWAWSSNIGLVNFNCEDQGVCTQSDYKVSLSPSGDLSGCAWSSSIGWIRFDPQTASAPGAPNQSAQIDTSAGLTSGWARACNVFQSDCSGTLKPDTDRGGWDGWIKMAKDPSDSGAVYGVSLNGNKLEGFAWGGDVIGWLNFDPQSSGGGGGGGGGGDYDVIIPGLVNCSNFSPASSSVKPSQTTNLNWQCQLAQNCSIKWETIDGTQNGSLGNVCNTEIDCNDGNDENVITNPITKKTTYTLTCNQGSFSAIETAVVNIDFAPTRCEVNPRTGVLECP